MKLTSAIDGTLKRILIVDDASLIRRSLSALLRRDDTYIKDVECGKDALREIEHLTFDLCFLDVNLPDINGLELMKLIKKTSPATKIIIMTGDEVDKPELMQSIQEHAHLLLPKPFDMGFVKRTVEQIIGQETSAHQAGTHSSVTVYDLFDRKPMDRKKRTCERTAVIPVRHCAVVALDDGQDERNFTAGILEMSETGMCIRTELLLKPGQFLRFTDHPAVSQGIVRWSSNGGGENSYRAGIQFIVPERTAPVSASSD